MNTLAYLKKVEARTLKEVIRLKLDVRDAQLSREQRKELISKRTALLFFSTWAVVLTAGITALIICAQALNMSYDAITGWVMGLVFLPLFPAAAVAMVYYTIHHWWLPDN